MNDYNSIGVFGYMPGNLGAGTRNLTVNVDALFYGKVHRLARWLEEKRWTLEDVVALTERHMAPKIEADRKAKAQAKREAEDAMFSAALNSIE